MKRVARALAAFAAEIARASAALGRQVTIDTGTVADRSDSLVLRRPGVWSPNRSCRMVRAADGWLAVNLPRPSDRLSVPAWISCREAADAWPAIVRAARHKSIRQLIDDARLLGLPVSGVGEVGTPSPDAPFPPFGQGPRPRDRRPWSVVDLSSLWAGPLCGGVLAGAGAAVTKIESRGRPDVLRQAAPGFFQRLNGAKRLESLDFQSARDMARLAEAIDGADAVITTARPRAFDQLGLSPETVFARNPGLTWVAITGHGWAGDGADRVAFGDDAAAAGGLVRFTPAGDPRFLGDALADPLTGLAAAAGAMRSVAAGGGALVDAAMVRTAAAVAGRQGDGGAGRLQSGDW